jgi:hypothetical protein
MNALIRGLALAALLLPAPARAEAPREIGWAALLPPATPKPDIKSKGFLANARPPGSESMQPPAPQSPEAGWMSMRSQQPGGDRPAPIVPELDGQRVRIGGYVVALDFDATRIKEFLLVPFVGACIHVPPPPANQIIYVKSAEGFETSSQFDPVYVTGTLRASHQVTGLAATGYMMEAETVEQRGE